ncbi:MAG: hypothetical protein WCO26_14800 [Deltaproteobacteria bacterium]
MRTWKDEVVRYQATVQRILDAALQDLDFPPHMPPLPVDPTIPSSPFTSWCYRAFIFYQLGSVSRTRETIESIRILLSEGYLSAAAPLIRLVFEVHAITNYLTETMKGLLELVRIPEDRRSKEETNHYLRQIDRVFEGVRSPVIMPRGEEASETPIHIRGAIRLLYSQEAENDYDFLCEGSHPNLPQYMQWQLAGKLGDNWSNDVAREHCHALLTRSFEILEDSTRKLRENVLTGVDCCDSIEKEMLSKSIQPTRYTRG